MINHTINKYRLTNFINQIEYSLNFLILAPKDTRSGHAWSKLKYHASSFQILLISTHSSVCRLCDRQLRQTTSNISPHGYQIFAKVDSLERCLDGKSDFISSLLVHILRGAECLTIKQNVWPLSGEITNCSSISKCSLHCNNVTLIKKNK